MGMYVWGVSRTHYDLATDLLYREPSKSNEIKKQEG